MALDPGQSIAQINQAVADMFKLLGEVKRAADQGQERLEQFYAMESVDWLEVHHLIMVSKSVFNRIIHTANGYAQPWDILAAIGNGNVRNASTTDSEPGGGIDSD